MSGSRPRSLPLLQAEVVACRRCPRLVEWREAVAREKRRAYQDETYWGRPVPSFGDPRARILLVGLAPGAHGANRTGRMFTGDDSGTFLYAALHRAGLASAPRSVSRDDGLVLRDVWITAAGRCAPPDNKPTREELQACSGFLDAEIALLRDVRVVLALGAIAFDAVIDAAARAGNPPAKPRPKFAHGALVTPPALPWPLLGSYHVSRQNTNTGRLTPGMFDEIVALAKRLAGV